jgi:LacI family transcriptional regulator
MVTIKDIARLAGVSYSTVSKALNGYPSVSEATRQRIMEIARSQGYQKNLIASQLSSQSSRLVGVALVEVNNPVFANLALLLHRAFRARNYHMILAVSLEEVETLSQLRVGGLVLWEDVLRTHPGVVGRIKTWSTPAFILGTDISLDVPHMRFDRRAGMREAMNYLQSFGHQRIGIIGGSQESKVRAYMEIMEELGTSSSVEDAWFPCEPTWEGGYRALKYARRDRPLPTALIGLNNLVAARLI